MHSALTKVTTSHQFGWAIVSKGCEVTSTDVNYQSFTPKLATHHLACTKTHCESHQNTSDKNWEKQRMHMVIGQYQLPILQSMCTGMRCRWLAYTCKGWSWEMSHDRSIWAKWMCTWENEQNNITTSPHLHMLLLVTGTGTHVMGICSCDPTLFSQPRACTSARWGDYHLWSVNSAYKWWW